MIARRTGRRATAPVVLAPVVLAPVVLVLVALALSGCGGAVSVEPPSLAGAHGREGGIGGTGIETGAGPGLFGTVTALGSIELVGERVRLDAATEVRDCEGPVDPARLGVGHAVTVETQATRGGLLAERVAVFAPLVGPVTALSGDGVLRVMDTLVATEGAALPPGLALGQRVAVSGLWRGDTVIAGRIEPAGDCPDRVAGLRVATERGPTIGATPLSATAYGEGAFVIATGVWTGEALAVGRERRRAFGPFDGPRARAVVEGVMAPDPDGEGVHLSGFGVAYDPASAARVETGRRAIFHGRLGRRFRVDAVEAPATP